MPKFKSNICGVRVATWGTSLEAGNGMPHFLNQRYFGGNPGHATVTVTFPADEQGKALIKQYCTNPPLPYEKHIIQVPIAKKEGAKYSASSDMMVEEEVYVVNFSWWPNANGVGFFVEPSENSDNLDEREGRNVNYEEKWRALLQPEVRIHRGRFGSTKMVYPHSVVTHKTALAQKQIELLDAETMYQLYEQRLESLAVLKDKFKDKSTKLKELKARKKRIDTKEKGLKANQSRLEALKALLKVVKNNQDPMAVLSESQQKHLKAAFPEWKDKIDIKIIHSKIKAVNADLKQLKADSYEKVKKDKMTFSQFSETEKILLDRFLPDWRESYKKGEFTTTALKDLRKKIHAEKKTLDLKKEELHSKINILQLEIIPLGKKEYLDDRRNSNIIKLKKLKAYFASLESTDDGSYRIKSSVKEQLDEFSKLTDVPWKNLVKLQNGKYRHMTKDEKEHIQNKINAQIETFEQKRYEKVASNPEYRNAHHRVVYDAWQEVYDSLAPLLDERSIRQLKANERIKTTTMQRNELDAAFAFTNLNWHGPESFLKDRYHITRSEAEALFSYVCAQMGNAKNKLVDEEPGMGRFNQNDFGNFLTRGHPPDTVVLLPLDKSSHANNARKHGMNVEQMLKEMQRIAKDEKFSLQSNNCSSTVSKILTAGAPGNYLKDKFRNRALAAIANPQMVMKNAMDFQSAMKDPKDNWFKKLMRFNPIERLGGWCVKKLFVDEKVKLGTKIAAGLLAIPTWIYAGVKITVGGLLEPLSSFKKLVNFASFANKTNSVGFKIIAAMGYIPALTILAPFAAIEYGISQSGKGIIKLFNKITGKKPVVRPVDYIDLNAQQLKDLESKQEIFNQASKEVLARLAVTEINALSTQEAINQFEEQAMEMSRAYALSEFKDNQYPLVMLSEETRGLFEREISILKNSGDPSTVAKGHELEQRYHGILKSNDFVLDRLNLIIQANFAKKMAAAKKEHDQVVEPHLPTKVNVAAIYAGAEQARLDFIRVNALADREEEKEVTVTEPRSSEKRQRMRQAAFAQFNDQQQGASKEEEPIPLKPGSKPNL
jgi:hypothetical protein